MQFQFHNLSSFCSSMRKNKKSLEAFDFSYNKIKFECLLDLDTTPFELMIGANANGNNFACILYIQKGYITEIPDKDYFQLCKLLNLNWNENHFSSSVFLRILDQHIPPKCNSNPVPIEKILPYKAGKLTPQEREEGFIFCGWLPHKGMHNGHVKNLNKTRQLLGNSVADYCERNDISSKWTCDPSKAQPLSFPWN